MTDTPNKNAQTRPHQTVKYLAKFLASFMGSAALCLTAYAALVESLVPSAEIPGSYKWFLLKEVPGPRIIFESGSNSHHAINTDAIGAALGMTAINIADNGGYAIEDKLTRLETFARKGDVIILPLEWTFYHREKLTDNYAETIFTYNRDYYRSMPMPKRLARALSLPSENVINAYSQKRRRPAAVQYSPIHDSPAQDLFIAALTQSTGHQSRQDSLGPGLGVAEQSCDDYVLGTAAQRRQLKLGSNIKPALARLKALKARGINIHFSWPVLTGDGCMSDPAYYAGFRTEIETAVTKAGFAFLAAPGQSLYGQDVQDDSPYHVTTKGAQAHTEKMIGFLKAQGYGSTGRPFDIKTFARHRLLALEIAASRPTGPLALPIGKIIAMDDAAMRPHVEFTAGWWAFEPYGRWMRDNRAVLRITLPKDTPENAVLKIQGITKSGKAERVNISREGQLIHSTLFSGSAPLLIAIGNLPKDKPLTLFIDLPEGDLPQSPRERGENQDARSMTLHFQNIELTASGEETQKLTLNKPATNILLAAQTDAVKLNMMTPIFNAAVSPDALADVLQKCLPSDDYFTTTQSQALSSRVTFTRGWWRPEGAGRWMKGQEADLEIILPARDKTPRADNSHNRYTLTLSGDFFMGREQTVSHVVSGQNAQSFKRAADGTLVSTILVPADQGTLTLSLKLSGQDVQSPKTLGLSQDDRTLTYFLKSAQITPA